MHPAAITAPPITVFIVEDTVPIRQRLELLVTGIPGARVIGHAEGADEAVARIIELGPDVVLLDLNLAQGCGMDVLRALKNSGREPDVFVLTNVATPQYRRACTALGAKGFFDKSTEFDHVREAISASALRKTYQF